MKSRKVFDNRTVLIETFGRTKKSSFIPSIEEIRYIGINCVSDSASYFLALLQRAPYITSKEEINDKAMGELLGVSEGTTKKRRLSLVNAKMIKYIKEGNMTIVLIGYESVIIHDVTGCSVIKVDAIRKIKKVLGIQSPEEFKEAIPKIQEMYSNNPEMFDK